jgi:hypothetical protein
MAGAASDAIVPNPYAPETWFALGLQWQQMVQTWAQWWLGEATLAAPAHALAPLAPAAHGPFDAAALAALNASFEPRLRSLWHAAHAAATQNGAMPQIAAETAADRRFASPAWRDQPYFAWLKQAMMMDPLTGAVLEPQEIWQMTDEMLVEEETRLPQYTSVIIEAKKRLKNRYISPNKPRSLSSRKRLKTIDEIRGDEEAKRLYNKSAHQN